jgi:hypothetical protein
MSVDDIAQAHGIAKADAQKVVDYITQENKYQGPSLATLPV